MDMIGDSPPASDRRPAVRATVVVLWAQSEGPLAHWARVRSMNPVYLRQAFSATTVSNHRYRLWLTRIRATRADSYVRVCLGDLHRTSISSTIRRR